MKKAVALLICLILLTGGVTAVSYAQPENSIFVSVSGDDSAAGTIENPVKTLARARELASDMSGAVTVYLRGGSYNFGETLTFTAGDRGGITFKAYNGEEVTFTSGTAYTGFEECEVNGVRAFKKDVGSADFNVLLSGETALRTPRYPSEGYLQVAGADDKWCINPDLEIDADFHKGYTAMLVTPSDVPEMKNIRDVTVRILHFWKDEMLKIDSFDRKSALLKFTKPTAMTLHKGERYFFENVFEALDEPGEWYLDRAQGVLYYVPEEGEDARSLTLWGCDTETLVSVDGADGICFEGIAFRGNGYNVSDKRDFSQAAFDAPACVTYKNAENILIKNCDFKDIAACAVHFGTAIKNARVDSCRFENIGAQAVFVNGNNVPVESGSVTKDITVTNCLVSGFGRVYYNAVGILATNANSVEISNNEIHDGYYTAVSVGWVWGYDYSVTYNNKITDNLIYNIGQGWLSDMGGIYTLGNQPGTVISGNVIHNVAADPGEGGYGGWGIYLDEGSSYITVEKNLVFACGSDGYHLHYGSYNTARNNIFALNGESQMRVVSNTRRVTPADGGKQTAEITRNIILCDGTCALSRIEERDSYADSGNLYWDISSGEDVLFNREGNPRDSMSFSRAVYKKYIHSSVTADPLFADAAAFDFELAENSPAFDTGFEKWDYSRAGTVKGTTVGVSGQGGTTPYNADAAAVEKTPAHEIFHLLMNFIYKKFIPFFIKLFGLNG